MKVVFQSMDKVSHSSGVFADVAQVLLKNESGRAGMFCRKEESSRLVSAGNGPCIVANSFQQEILKLPGAVIDFTHSTVMPERGDDISHILFGLHVYGKYDDRQCWPDIQRLRVA